MRLIDRFYFDPPVTEASAFAAAPEEKTKDFLAKVGQLVPAEILGAYGSALGAVPLWSESSRPWAAFAVFILGVLGTAWYVGWALGKGFRRQRHVLVYTGAFIVWAYSLTGEVVLAPIYHPGVAVLAPIIASVIFAKIKLPKKPVKP